MAEAARPASPPGAGLEAGWLQTIFLMLASRRLNGSSTSVPGQKQKSNSALPSSAFLPRADIASCVCDIPKNAITEVRAYLNAGGLPYRIVVRLTSVLRSKSQQRSSDGIERDQLMRATATRLKINRSYWPLRCGAVSPRTVRASSGCRLTLMA